VFVVAVYADIHGGMVPVQTRVESARFQGFRLKYGKLLSSSAFKAAATAPNDVQSGFCMDA
jgi:hypothetical protein